MFLLEPSPEIPQCYLPFFLHSNSGHETENKIILMDLQNKDNEERHNTEKGILHKQSVCTFFTYQLRHKYASSAFNYKLFKKPCTNAHAFSMDEVSSPTKGNHKQNIV